jgi:hypothetical protein
MFRRLLLLTVTALGLATPLAYTAPAQTVYVGPSYVQVRPACFRVLYRRCPCDPWVRYGTYHCRCDAEAAVRALRCQGFRVIIRV